MLNNKNFEFETLKESKFVVIPFDEGVYNIQSYVDIIKDMLDLAQAYYEEQIAPYLDELKDMEQELQIWSSYKDTSPEGVLKYLIESDDVFYQVPDDVVDIEDYINNLDEDDYDIIDYSPEWYDENINDGWN